MSDSTAPNEPKPFPKSGAVSVRGNDLQPLKSKLKVGEAFSVEDADNDYVDFFASRVILRGKVQLPEQRIDDLGETVRHLKTFATATVVWATAVTVFLAVLLLYRPLS